MKRSRMRFVSISMAIAAGCSPAPAGTPGTTTGVPAVHESGKSTPEASAPLSASSASSSGARALTWMAPPDPGIASLLAVATLACTQEESFSTEKDGRRTRSYVVYAPALAQADLEQRFTDAVRKLGFVPHGESGGQIMFGDDARGLGGFLTDARIMIVVDKAPAHCQLVHDLANAAGFDSVPVVDRLCSVPGGNVRFARSGATILDLEASGPVTSAQQKEIDAWARSHSLTRSDGTWIRKFQKSPPVAGIAIDVDSNGLAFLSESRTDVPVDGPCVQHPSRVAQAAAAGSAKAEDPADKAEQERLLKEMMGD